MNKEDVADLKSFPTRVVYGDTVSEGFHNALIESHNFGKRLTTPKHRDGLPLGYDSNVTVNILHPEKEPKIHMAGLIDDPRGLVQYILEVTHGIHNHWVESSETAWGYTYHKRFDNQIPFVLARMKNDLEKKGRVSGRDYFFSTWRPEKDNILEQEDPPCFQNGQIRLTPDDKDGYYLHLLTDWRSRDLVKAWNENAIAFTKLQELLAKKVSNVLERDVKVGSYIDTSSSLHIYGAYLPEGLETTIKNMKKEKHKRFGMDLDTFLSIDSGETRLKRLVGAQLDAEQEGHGKNLPDNRLIELGYDIGCFQYPSDWDSWPNSWDREVDPKLLED